MTKPFLKWVGGKTQIIDKIIEHFPLEINNYHEIFLGGGSVLLALLQEGKIKVKGHIYAYDLNNDLINVYKTIQNNEEELYNYLQEYYNEYDSCPNVIEKINRNPDSLEEARKCKENYYYWMRNKYNKNKLNIIESSALFIILNKTCFRGLYRVGPNGFNVPYGHYKKTPTLISRDHLNQIKELIKDVKFIHSDFSESFKNIKKGDFVYLDPPYAPEKSNSFVNYTNEGFGIEQHNLLFSLIKELNNKKIKFLMSNAKVELVLEHFKEYKIIDVLCRRAINAKNPETKTMEVLVMNI